MCTAGDVPDDGVEDTLTTGGGYGAVHHTQRVHQVPRECRGGLQGTRGGGGGVLGVEHRAVQSCGGAQ